LLTASRKLKTVLLGLHHVTAFAADPQQCLEFYTQFLGLRLVKRTVNYDDPATYHFYFGNATGTPGTLLTFFPWPTAPAGRGGTGQALAASFSVPKNSLPRWIDRAAQAGVDCTQPHPRFGEEVIALFDRAGLPVELIASAPESDSDAIVALHSSTLCEAETEKTVQFLTETLGFRFVGQESNRARFTIGDTPLDLMTMPGFPRGKLTSGMVHHLAWRVIDEKTQIEWREKLVAAGCRVTRVMDRKYFRSIYFREPGGVLFEIATDGPGFLVDEAQDQLGMKLQLPPWLEPIRAGIEARLPAVTLPQTTWQAR
jgi:glyoxalase family protein